MRRKETIVFRKILTQTVSDIILSIRNSLFSLEVPMENIIINSRDKILECGKVFEFTNEESLSLLAQSIKDLDTAWGIHIKNDYLNNYENGDYLVVTGILQSIRKLHEKIYYNPNTNQWIRNNKGIPYIHLNVFVSN